MSDEFVILSAVSNLPIFSQGSLCGQKHHRNVKIGGLVYA